MRTRFEFSANLLAISFVLLVSASSAAQTHWGVRRDFVSLDAHRFVDGFGRHVTFHGLNLVNKDPFRGYLGDETPETFADMRRWGFNVVRLGVVWDGLEPVDMGRARHHHSPVDHRGCFPNRPPCHRS